MDLKNAISARHSVRTYLNKPLTPDVIGVLTAKIDEINKNTPLNIQLVVNEPRAFQGPLAKYGKFSGVTNYLVVAGKKSETLDEQAGYYGEQLVLFAQTQGLNTCWVGLSYSKIPGTYTLSDNEKIVCYIALGYGAAQGTPHKIKTPEQVSNTSSQTPDWFHRGVNAALLAPTAINQQKFHFQYIPKTNGKAIVRASRKFSLAGYTKVDLGIAKLHFELAAGLENFTWEQC